MRSAKPMFVMLILMLVIGVSILVTQKYTTEDNRYDELVKTYECYPWPCIGDFNGDGKADYLTTVRTGAQHSPWSLVVFDSERELFRREYTSIDGTLRTHAAIRITADGACLLIFDGTSGQHENEVYMWNGERMAAIAPTPLDREILAAMAARDDTGGWHWWAMYHLFRDFLFSFLVIIPILLVVSVSVFRLLTRFNIPGKVWRL